MYYTSFLSPSRIIELISTSSEQNVITPVMFLYPSCHHPCLGYRYETPDAKSTFSLLNQNADIHNQIAFAAEEFLSPFTQDVLSRILDPRYKGSIGAAASWADGYAHTVNGSHTYKWHWIDSNDHVSILSSLLFSFLFSWQSSLHASLSPLSFSFLHYFPSAPSPPISPPLTPTLSKSPPTPATSPPPTAPPQPAA